MNLDRNMVLFNVAGVLTVLVVGIYFVRVTLFPEGAPVCSQTYPNQVQLPLERHHGDLFTAAELQARLAGRDLGVIDHSRVVNVKGVQGPVLEVSLPKGSLSQRVSGSNKGGIAFQWRPRNLDQASAVCLAYSVWLPEDFDFKRGGTLPGLYGAVDGGRDDEKIAFATRYMWRDAGATELLATLPHNGETRTTSMDADAFRLPRGKWIRLEQEVVLNTPGKKNGSIRVWAGGRVVVDRRQMLLRDSNVVTFAGVQADVHYGGSDTSFVAPKDTQIRLTPFEVRLP